MLASIVRENRPGRTVRLVDPVRTHGYNPLKRAYIYALLDSHGVMRVIGGTVGAYPARIRPAARPGCTQSISKCAVLSHWTRPPHTTTTTTSLSPSSTTGTLTI